MGLFGKSKDKSEVAKHYTWDSKKPLGSGNFAEVFKADLTTKNRQSPYGSGDIPDVCALKVIDKSKVEDMNDIVREIEIMQKVQHKHVIRLFEVFSDSKKEYLVMELVTGGELFDRIVEKGNYTEKDAATCIVQLCDALEALHKQGVVHRDLKPENLLYAAPMGAPGGDDIKVADFGLAREVAATGQMMKTACGTPGYVAPEILANKGYDNTAVDMWSVGVILYILLCGFPPFYEEELPALFDSILKARFDFPSPWWDGISDLAKKLVNELLELSPQKRLTATQVKDHAWIGSAAPTALGTAATLKKYQANQRFRKAALGIIAQQRIQRAFADFQSKQPA